LARCTGMGSAAGWLSTFGLTWIWRVMRAVCRRRRRVFSCGGHRPIEDGGWEVWTDQASDDVSLTYIVRCSNTENGHAYSEKDVPEAVTRIIDKAARITETVNRITGRRRTT
jgi:hypothetical protein